MESSSSVSSGSYGLYGSVSSGSGTEYDACSNSSSTTSRTLTAASKGSHFASKSSLASGSSKHSGFQFPLDEGRYHGHRGSDSDAFYYSAKVSDFEAGDSRSVGSGCRSAVLSGEGSDNETDFSAQVSDDSDLNSGTEMDESASEASSSSRMESELSYIDGTDPGAVVPIVPNIFLTQGKKTDDADIGYSQMSDLEPDLIQATKHGDAPLVKKLIARGCNLEATDSNRRTALHLACSLGRLEIVRLLVEGGANVDAASVTGQTPLHEACINGRYDVLVEMISEVIDLDMVDSNGLSAAHYCAMNGEVKCLTLLCNQGSDICLEDREGRSGVHLAAMRGHQEVIQCLMERGMELDTVDVKGKTPAHYAAKYGSIKCLKCLMKSAVDMNTGDQQGQEPIHEAASADSLETLQLLHKKAIKLTVTDNKGQTPVHKASQSGGLKCLHWLLEKGVNPNAVDKLGLSGLHHAASGGHSECFYCLLQHGADSSLRTLSGDNALDVARRHGKPRVISKAVDGIQRCFACENKKMQMLLAGKKSSSPISLKLKSESQTLFANPMPPYRSVASAVALNSKRKSMAQSSKSSSSEDAVRNLAAKYFGPPYRI